MDIIEKGISAIKDICKDVIGEVHSTRQPAQVDSNDTVLRAEDGFLPFLQQYNCKYELIEDDDENFTHYLFDYQGGHFVALVSKHGFGIEVSFPRMMDVPLSQLNAVRKVVNDKNYSNTQQKFLYRFYDDENIIGISMCFNTKYFTFNQFHDALTQCFSEQREVSARIEEVIKDSVDAKTNDMEENVYSSRRELFLIRHQEIKHSSDPFECRISPEECLTVEHIFHNLVERKDILFKRMQIVTNHLEEVNEAQEVANFNIASITTQATLIINYTSPLFKGEEVATITITQADADDFARYFRVSVTLSFEEPSRHNSINKRNKTKMVFNFLYGVNHANHEKMEAEFDYMWKDALIKLDEGKMNELTEEQSLIISISHAQTAYNAYWATRYMNQQRYFEAIAHLENAFAEIKTAYFNLDDKFKGCYNELCYRLGFCYNELHLYEKAYYYLELVSHVGRIDYTMEWINAQANSNDIRIFRSIAVVNDELHETFGKDDDVPEKIQKFMSFLARRRAYALVSFGNLDEAEQEFKELLNDPNSRDYALSELAYIEKKRNAENRENDTEQPDTAPDAEPDNTTPPPFTPEQE